MPDDEHRVVQVEVHADVAEEEPGEPADPEHEHRPEREQHRRVVAQRPLPHREQPVEEQHHRRDADDQREQHEALAQERAHAGHEHVVAVDHRARGRSRRPSRPPCPGTSSAGLRAKNERRSPTMPQAGRIRM